VSRPLVLILGGTRSGKSRLGRQRAELIAAGGPVAYVATALPGDAELDDRIALHRRDRPSAWQTVEPLSGDPALAGAELVEAIRAFASGTTILIDGLTLWVSLVMADPEKAFEATTESIVEGPIERLREALRDHPGPAVVVIDEVGLGIVPMDAITRRFRDVLGIAHQRLADDADEVWLTVAGRGLRLDKLAEAVP
jgi:adenosylcobinamide kinase / adenosylcobinamide-phosphate guanylyltransferase